MKAAKIIPTANRGFILDKVLIIGILDDPAEIFKPKRDIGAVGLTVKLIIILNTPYPTPAIASPTPTGINFPEALLIKLFFFE